MMMIRRRVATLLLVVAVTTMIPSATALVIPPRPLQLRRSSATWMPQPTTYSSTTSIAKPPIRRQQQSGSLCMKQNNDQNKGKDDGDKARQVDMLLERLVQTMEAVLPDPVMENLRSLWTKFSDSLPGLRIAAISFVAGLVMATGAILFPVYSSVESSSLSEPIVLFETILSELDQGYVDPVDTKKLFETGISAMLRSLDPYTEFENQVNQEQLTEGIQGRYGGVGLVISGASPKDNSAKLTRVTLPGDDSSSSNTIEQPSKLLPKEAIEDKVNLEQGDDDMKSGGVVSSSAEEDDDDEGLDEYDLQVKKDRNRAIEKARSKGIRVVSAFEGYAFDYGMRVGDKILAVNDQVIGPDSTVDQVRSLLRGEPGTEVKIQFEREGVDGVQEVSIPRRIVQLRDVKLATLIGNPSDGIGYISLSGFARSAGQEVRQAIFALEHATQIATNGGKGLQGLILDLRGNPGGLLTSAVDVSSLLVPKGSDIVSAKGRGFPGVIYRSKADPILSQDTKLAVLVNSGTASAAEIVSGAVQDLDVGVIIGSDRTFGKGLVQNVEDLPFNTALKFTVAKYYTPSGRCIQGVNYKEGGGLREEDGRFESSKVSEKDRQTFYTRLGRIVKDGGGIEADYKVAAPKACKYS